MKKKNLRFLSFIMSVLLVISVILPVPATAASDEVVKIKQQISNTYKKAKAYYGWSSFHGFCGALVNAQLYLLGITDTVLGVDGRDAYDAFKRLTVTSGGFGVKTYPAGMYSVKSALNAITKNGTEDAYNILVGFEKTPSVLGRRYGHAVVIHAIIDGTVYYVESYSLSLNGVYYPEGTPISASIEDFAGYYAQTTTQFDGVVHFGLKTYADTCTQYPSNATATVTGETAVWSQPCENTVFEGSEQLGDLTPGEQVNVTGLYLNTEQQYWYQLNGGEGGYVPAEKLDIAMLCYDDVQLSNSVAPTVLTKGKSFSIKGAVTAKNNSIYSIRARVYRPEADQMVQVINTSDTVQGMAYDLLRSKISSGLTFRTLPEGQYRYELAAIVANYYLEGGKLMTSWNTVNLWTSDFLVVADKTTVHTITFDTCGGTMGLDQSVVPQDVNVGVMEVPQRAGYTFLGWFTEETGGQKIAEDYIPEGNMTVYAHWISHEQLRQEWLAGGNCWYLYSDGISTMICFELEGTLCYFSSMEPMCQNWMVWTDSTV